MLLRSFHSNLQVEVIDLQFEAVLSGEDEYEDDCKKFSHAWIVLIIWVEQFRYFSSFTGMDLRGLTEWGNLQSFVCFFEQCNMLLV